MRSASKLKNIRVICKSYKSARTEGNACLSSYKCHDIVSCPLRYEHDRQDILTLHSPIKKVTLNPDERVTCFDYLYFTASVEVSMCIFTYLSIVAFNRIQPWELSTVVDYSPAWNAVGKYLHFTPRLEDIADQYIRRALQVPPGITTPAVSFVLVPQQL